MEPERKIEKLLRAYAKKRKADAGDAFTLHPATRRRLQAEVDRQFAEPPEEESVSLWQLFRQQWAVLAVFALVIFFGASLFLPALSKAKMKSQSVSAMSNLKQIGIAAQMSAVDNSGKLPATLDELTNNHLLSEKVLTDPASGKRFVFAAGGEKLDALASNVVLAYSPEDKKGRAMLLADGSVQMMSRKQFDDLTQRELKAPAAPAEVAFTRRAVTEKSDRLAFDQPVPAAAPVVASGTVALNGINNFGSGGGGGGGGNTFASENKDRLVATAAPAAAPAKQFFKDAERTKSEALGVNSNSQKFRNAVANTAPVLVSFELQQNGNDLAVVDADGSVYQGSLQTNSAVAQSQLPVVMPPGAPQSQVSDVAKNQSAAGNSFYFRVAGQNRTSKQNVVFTGNLVPLAGNGVNAQTGAAENNSAGISGMSQAQNAALFSNSRIAGNVTVDITNQIEINAVPVTP
jgi:hypothetical protein